MKRLVMWLLVGCSIPLQGWAQGQILEDRTAEEALVIWQDPRPWQARLLYTRLSRPVEMEDEEWRLRTDIVEAEIGVRPWPWLLLFARAGGSEARLDPRMTQDAKPGASGGGGLSLNLWQIHQGATATAWRLTLPLRAEYLHRSTQDSHPGRLRWEEARISLPLTYHLTYARSIRHANSADFQSLTLFGGPVYSTVTGRWSPWGTRHSFSEKESLGIIGGAEFWLVETVAFGACAEWYEHASLLVTARYQF